MSKGMADLTTIDWSSMPAQTFTPDPTPQPTPQPSTFTPNAGSPTSVSREVQTNIHEANLAMARGDYDLASQLLAQATARQQDIKRGAKGEVGTGGYSSIEQARQDAYSRLANRPAPIEKQPETQPNQGDQGQPVFSMFSSEPVAQPTPEPVKDPGRDVIAFARNDLSPTGIINLLFESIGGVEISTIARRDTIEGQNPYYGLISNLSTIRKEYDATKLISRQKPNQSIFDRYAINLDSRIPGQLYLSQKNLNNFFYIDNNGDLVVELDNMIGDEEIQVEIAGSGTIRVVSES
jgi:hypothetical protein